MTTLTLFTAPKPFTDPHINTIQRNAIRSWTLLPDTKVILLGEEEGLAAAARDLGVIHLPNVARNKNGTPLISSMFALAREHSDSPLLCIINADILLFPDFVESAQNVAEQLEHFVMLGRRWDLDVRESLDFSDGWENRLRERARREGSLHKPAGSDYFIFPRVCYTDIPDFAIGRAGWDNWMIYKARREGWATIDSTKDIFIIHQNHDYRHLPGGQPHYKLPETKENIRLAGGVEKTHFTIIDANRRLEKGKIRLPRISLKKIFREIEILPVLHGQHPKLTLLLFAIFHPKRMLRRLTRKDS